MRRALIVIDVQNEYVSGDLPIEYPDVRLSLRNIGRAIDAARTRAIPVLVVQNTAPAGSPLFARGTPGWELHPVVASRKYDAYFEKSLPSVFAGTELGAWLERERIDTLSVVGYMTHNCVDATIKHALHAGFRGEVLYDATGSVSYRNQVGAVSAREIHQATSVVLQSRFAAVVTTDAWLSAIERGVECERDNIFASNQRARMQVGEALG